jgi:putative intracellular protease/amidase
VDAFYVVAGLVPAIATGSLSLLMAGTSLVMTIQASFEQHRHAKDV